MNLIFKLWFIIFILSSCANSSKSQIELDCSDALINYSRDSLQEEFASEFGNQNLFLNQKSNFYYTFKVIRDSKKSIKISVHEFNDESMAYQILDFLNSKNLNFIDCSIESFCCESLIVVNGRFNIIWFPESYEELYKEDIR